MDNATFLQKTMFNELSALHADVNGKWGIMNVQEMVEHLADFFDISSARLKFPVLTPPERLPAAKEFIYSDKEFRPNTKAPVEVLGEMPIPLRTINLDAAIQMLQDSVEGFYACFEGDENKTVSHPVFGELNRKEWEALHAKHVRHHLRQFGLWA